MLFLSCSPVMWTSSVMSRLDRRALQRKAAEVPRRSKKIQEVPRRSVQKWGMCNCLNESSNGHYSIMWWIVCVPTWQSGHVSVISGCILFRYDRRALLCLHLILDRRTLCLARLLNRPLWVGFSQRCCLGRVCIWPSLMTFFMYLPCITDLQGPFLYFFVLVFLSLTLLGVTVIDMNLILLCGRRGTIINH